MGKGKQAGWGTIVLVVGLLILKGVNQHQRLERLQAGAPQRVAHADPDETQAAAPAPDRVFAAASPAVVLIEVRGKRGDTTSQGSGFFVSGDGLLVTNYHVIAGGASAVATTADGRELVVTGAAAVLPQFDLALLTVKTLGKAVPYLELSKGKTLAIGSRVFAIGNPRGLTNTLSDGLVSGLRELEGFEGSLIQISAPISPGSSGGPLLAANGTVVGVTTAGINDAQNLNFAVPAGRVTQLIDARGEPRALSSLQASYLAGAAGGSAAQSAASPQVHGRIDALLGEKKYGAAMALLREIAPGSSASATYWCQLGRAHEDGYGNLGVAEDAFRRATKLLPTYKLAHERLAHLLVRRNRCSEAIASFRALAQLDPKRAEPYVGAGKAAAQMGEHGQAVTFYDWALKLQPADGTDIQEMRGHSLFHLRRDDDAAAAFNAVLKARPTSLVALHGVGELHLRAGRTDEAKRQFNDVIRLYPQYPRAHLQLGHIAKREGDDAGARAAWQKVIRYDPAGPDGRAAMEQLLLLPGTIRRVQ